MDDDPFDDSGCLYNGINNTHCALGRLFIAKYRNQGEDFENNEVGILTLADNLVNNIPTKHNHQVVIDKLLKPSYRGHSLHFWVDIQSLHDDKDYWYADKATDAGYAWMRTLRRKWNEEDNNNKTNKEKR